MNESAAEPNPEPERSSSSTSIVWNDAAAAAAAAENDETTAAAAMDMASWNSAAEQRAQNCTRASLPTLDHVSMRDFAVVYEPAQDTFLLLDALQYEADHGAWDDLLQLLPRQNCPPIQQQHSGNLKKSSCSVPDTSSSCKKVTETTPAVIFLEIGCGSGVVSITARQLWNKRYSNNLPHVRNVNVCRQEEDTQNDDAKSVLHLQPMKISKTMMMNFVTDINPHALHVCRQTAIANGVLHGGNTDTDTINHMHNSISTNNSSSLEDDVWEFIRCDLASPLLHRLQGSVHVILFNPPYVPTPDEEIQGYGIEVSWAGGAQGRRVIDRAIPQMAQLLLSEDGSYHNSNSNPVNSPPRRSRQRNGIIYMITVDDNQTAEIANLFDGYGLAMKPLLRRRAYNEALTVQKVTWKS